MLAIVKNMAFNKPCGLFVDKIPLFQSVASSLQMISMCFTVTPIPFVRNA